MLKPEMGFNFERRSRRPPADPTNALLSFAYSLLTADLISAIQTVGLDPYVGFFHQQNYGRPCLALDLMEEFRPIIADSVVITLINKRQVKPDDFTQSHGGWFLKTLRESGSTPHMKDARMRPSRTRSSNTRSTFAVQSSYKSDCLPNTSWERLNPIRR